jgi:proteasome lid subunit RPN8/RPN11
VILAASALATIEHRSRAARPGEYCAALLGTGETVTGVVRLRNCDPRPGHFALPDAELRRADWAARTTGRDVLALLHSHPFGPPVLSAEDRRSLAVSGHPWVIAAFDAEDRLVLAAFAAGTVAEEKESRQADSNR